MDYIVTGTRVYGPAGPDSDLDIVVKLNDIGYIVNYLSNHGVQMYRTPGQDEYGVHGGFYFDFIGIKINIIVAENEDDFIEWDIKTEKMKKLPIIPDRDLRVKVFNSYFGVEELESLIESHSTKRK